MKRTQLDFLLYKSSLLDDASERKRQALARTVQMHKLYVSSVSAVDTILHKVMPLRTSRASQDKYDMWPRRNCVPVSVCSVFMTLYVYLQVFKVLQRNERPWRTTTLGSCAQMVFESNCRRREKLRGGLHRFLGSESRQVILQVGEFGSGSLHLGVMESKQVSTRCYVCFHCVSLVVCLGCGCHWSDVVAVDDVASLHLHCAVHQFLFAKSCSMMCAKMHPCNIQVANDDEWTT